MASTERAIEPGFRLRPATPADMRAAFTIFRRSIMDYVHRRGIVDSPFVTESALEEAWNVRDGWIEHLWRTAGENWLAIDIDGRAIGWAMSIERGGLLELSHFFVDPDTQSKGIGRALLERAFPRGRSTHRATRSSFQSWPTTPRCAWIAGSTRV